VRRVRNEHLSGTRNWEYLRWDVLMFKAWLASREVWHALNPEMLHA